MEQRLQEVLLDGEIVRWSGRPSPFKLMSIPSRTSLLLTWVLCSAALAVILGGLIPFFLRTHQAVTDLTVILMIAAFLPAMISIRPLLDKWSLEHDTIYAITNYRVLALVKNNLMYILDNAILGVRCGSPAQSGVPGLLFFHIPQPESLLGYLS